MTIDDAIFSRLVYGSSILSAMIGTRCYPVIMPQNAPLPAITRQRISGPRLASLLGQSGVANPRMQVDCWAETNTEAHAVADEVRRLLHGFQGWVGTVWIGGSLLIGDREFYEPATRTHRVSMDFSIWHPEDDPAEDF